MVIVVTMEASSNSRDGLSSTSLQLSVEQWELLRRLRNSQLTKTQIIRAYDELDRLDRELGNLFQTNNGSVAAQRDSSSPSTNSPPLPQNFPLTTTTTTNPNKRSHCFSTNGSTSRSSTTTITNGYSPQLHHHNSSPNIVNRSTTNGNNSLQQFEPLTSTDIEEETRELQELLAKGDGAIHNEISVFVYRYDLKQSQIARMAAVNQAYVSKFLRGDLFDLSENGRMAICRWYIRYRKIVQSMGSNPSSVEFLSNYTSSCEPPTKMARLMESPSNNNPTNTSSNAFDAPKRTRFTFRPEHLDILEKAFIDNPYPDPRRREDLARLCNEARARVDGTNELLNERDRVTDAIVTHWFQNKRKMAKSQRVSVHDDSISMNLSSNSNNHLSSTNDFENVHSDDDVHVHSNHGAQKAFGALADIDCYDLSSSTSLLDPQLAAYRAIMSRMIPFANHMNGNNRSPHRNSTSNANGSSVVKQEAMTNADESSQDNESNVSSPIGEHSTP